MSGGQRARRVCRAKCQQIDNGLSQVRQARRRIDRAVAHVLLDEMDEAHAVGKRAALDLRDGLQVGLRLARWTRPRIRLEHDRGE